MPPKPTCKVVKREGQRGARIDPKGCKVRTSVNAQGSKTKEDKQGQEKIKRTTRSGKMQLAVAGNRQRHFINNWNDKPAAVRSQYKQNHHILYDTGANMTTMTPNTLRHIGYNPDRQSNVSSTNVSDASGNVTQRKILNNVVFYVLLKSDKNREGRFRGVIFTVSVSGQIYHFRRLRRQHGRQDRPGRLLWRWVIFSQIDHFHVYILSTHTFRGSSHRNRFVSLEKCCGIFCFGIFRG